LRVKDKTPTAFLIEKSLSAFVDPTALTFNPSVVDSADAAQSKGSLKLTGLVNLIVRLLRHASNPARLIYL
jgi:hypothetical protein